MAEIATFIVWRTFFRHLRTASRLAGVPIISLLVLVGGAGAAVAAPAPSRVLPPEEAFGIAAGLADAASSLALQCGMGKLGEKIRVGGASPTTRVASAAVKDSLAFAKATQGCSAATEVLKAVGVIVAFAEINQPVYVTLQQSTKKHFWPKPDTCSFVIRVGASESLAKDFKGSFSC